MRTAEAVVQSGVISVTHLEEMVVAHSINRTSTHTGFTT
jgi:hypothetical protein